jgi:large subunit ribosomal protein L6
MLKNNFNFTFPSTFHCSVTSNQIIVWGPRGVKAISFISSLIHIYYFKEKNMLVGRSLSLSKNKKSTKKCINLSKLENELQTVVKGLLRGYFFELKLTGVGYRFLSVSNNLLKLKIGYSHVLSKKISESVVLLLESPVQLSLFSKDYTLLKQVISDLKKIKKQDIYKGKGLALSTDQKYLKEFKKK